VTRIFFESRTDFVAKIVDDDEVGEKRDEVFDAEEGALFQECYCRLSPLEVEIAIHPPKFRGA